jgi:hypothetical protein
MTWAGASAIRSPNRGKPCQETEMRSHMAAEVVVVSPMALPATTPRVMTDVCTVLTSPPAPATSTTRATSTGFIVTPTRPTMSTG